MTHDAASRDVPAFYDDFAERQVAGYINGNPRVDAAVQHAVRWIPDGARRILDIGCGVGSGTWELKRNYLSASILGVDISPKSVETAKAIFGCSGLEYAHCDISQWNPLFDTPFDAIIMMDVYEHIRPEERPAVHAVLARALGRDGALILTVPSTLHQNYLREHEPAGLQPVDEDITFDVIARLAHDIGGQVLQFNHVTVWRTGDYVHVVIQRNPRFIWKEQVLVTKPAPAESKARRARRAAARGGLCASAAASTAPASRAAGFAKTGGKVVCVIHPNRETYSETFVAAHVRLLPAEVTSLYGGWFPTHTKDDKPLLPAALRMAALAERRLPRGPRTFINGLRSRNLEQFLTAHKTGLVLAEYGPTGVAVGDICKKAGIPFAVHFHGFDAYDKPTLDEYAAGYRRVFADAAAIIAVSRHMEQHLLNLGAPREKLFYNPCGADTALFANADPANAPPHFVAVGRFADKKAPQLTLLAFAKVRETCPAATLTMIGDGYLWESCKQMAQALGIGNSVRFPGPLPHAQIAMEMRRARAFVQHSVTHSAGDSEGTPVAVMEAGACGLPVVSTRHGGIPDVIIHEQTGFLVDERDVDTMARYMTALATDAALAGSIGRRAQDHIRANFSLDKSIDQLWKIISGVMK